MSLRRPEFFFFWLIFIKRIIMSYSAGLEITQFLLLQLFPVLPTHIHDFWRSTWSCLAFDLPNIQFVAFGKISCGRVGQKNISTGRVAQTNFFFHLTTANFTTICQPLPYTSFLTAQLPLINVSAFFGNFVFAVESN